MIMNKVKHFCKNKIEIELTKTVLYYDKLQNYVQHSLYVMSF